MDTARYLDAIRRDGAGLLDAARAADPGAPIAACPGWTPIDLVWHIGEVHRFWSTVVGERLAEPPPDWPPERPADDDVWPYAAESVEMVVDVLATADPATPVWTWSSQHDVAFVIRRMAQETAVHRIDAEQAAGRAPEVEAELAADGIDEFLTFFLAYTVKDPPPLGGSVHLHCTDVEGEWTITTGDDGAYVVTRDHAKADTALRGTASDLLLVLWRRRSLDDATDGGVDVFGDRDVAARFVARTDND